MSTGRSVKPKDGSAPWVYGQRILDIVDYKRKFKITKSWMWVGEYGKKEGVGKGRR